MSSKIAEIIKTKDLSEGIKRVWKLAGGDNGGSECGGVVDRDEEGWEGIWNIWNRVLLGEMVSWLKLYSTIVCVCLAINC